MFHHQKHSLISGLFATLLISFTTLAHAQGGGNGGGNAGGSGVAVGADALQAVFGGLPDPFLSVQGESNGNTGGNGVPAALSSVKTDIDELQSDVAALQSETAGMRADLMALSDAIAGLEGGTGPGGGISVVDVDCTADSNALQTAIDAAPPAGAIIRISGVCDRNYTFIRGKSNILLDGDDLSSGNGLSGSLQIAGSNNVQLSDINVGTSISVNDVSSVIVRDIIANNVGVESNSRLNQYEGKIQLTEGFSLSDGATAWINNASMEGVYLQGNAALRIVPFSTDGVSPSVEFDRAHVWTGSFLFVAAYSFRLSGEEPNLGIGAVAINGDVFLDQSGIVELSGDMVRYNGSNITLRRNSSLDVSDMPATNFNPNAVIELWTGSGARTAFDGWFDDASEPREALCFDGSVWTSWGLVCAE